MWSRTCRAWSLSRRSRAPSVHVTVDGVEVGGERRLGVDHHRLPARQPHDQVGPEPAVLAVDARLLLEVAVVEHPRHLDDPPELDLAPAPAHVGRAECLHQVPGLGLERLLGARHRPHLLDQPGVGGDPLLLDLLQLPVHPRERLLDRPHQVAHRLLPPLEIRGRALLELAELGLGEVRKLWLFCRSASAESEAKASRRVVSARSSSATRSPAARRSAAIRSSSRATRLRPASQAARAPMSAPMASTSSRSGRSMTVVSA